MKLARELGGRWVELPTHMEREHIGIYCVGFGNRSSRSRVGTGILEDDGLVDRRCWHVTASPMTGSPDLRFNRSCDGLEEIDRAGWTTGPGLVRINSISFAGP